MKKNLVAALATALTIGAASTTFAAANPFSDVPRDHWAYDAVTQLAADGVIEGYGDGTYRGDRNITRYEMAQMVGKAMAKGDMSTSDKALVDRLAAEFADELNNLGVRVANLEKHSDMVKWGGFLRYEYTSIRHEGKARANKDNLMFRVIPTAEVNKNWKVTARLTGQNLMNKDSGEGKETLSIDRAHAIGTYGKLEVRLGQMNEYSDADNGMIFDTTFSGATVRFGNVVKAKVAAGRIASDRFKASGLVGSDPANYQSLELNYTAGKLRLGAGYHHLNTAKFKTVNYAKSGKEDNANIWDVGASYAFDKNFTLKGGFAQNTAADAHDRAGSVSLWYKGAKKTDAGSWGMFLGYHHLGKFVAFDPTNNAIDLDQKGWEVGLQYTPLKNILGKVEYFKGKDISTDKDASKLFVRLDYNF